MSEQKNNRYPGIQPFRSDQSNIFHGRTDEIRRLYSVIIQERLTVLYGRSGYGKSSLIEAGLIPLLKNESQKGKQRFLPVVVRFNAYQSGDKLLDKYKFHHQKALDKFQDNVTSIGLPPLPDTLWGLWKGQGLPERTQVVLIFDQFEEFFTYPESQREAFKEQLAELLYSDYPLFLEDYEGTLSDVEAEYLSERLEVRALFAIRSDRLSELDRLKDRLPAILHKRIELGPLSVQQARQAIILPAGLEAELAPEDRTFYSPPFEFREETVERLLTILQNSQSAAKRGVEAFLLQVFCDAIENKVADGDIPDRDGNGLPDVEIEDLPPTDEVLDQYYERQLKKIPSDRREAARAVIEDGLVQVDDNDGLRLSVDGRALVETFSEQGVDEELLEALVTSYLLRREPNSTEGMSYELSHDTLLVPVLKSRKQRDAERLREQLAKERSKRRRGWAFGIAMGVLALLALVSLLRVNSQAKLIQETQEELVSKNDKLVISSRQKEKALAAVKDREIKLERTIIDLQTQTGLAAENERKALSAARLADQRATRANQLAATLSDEDAFSFLLESGNFFFIEKNWRDALTNWGAARFLAPIGSIQEKMASERVALAKRALRGQRLIEDGNLWEAHDTFILLLSEMRRVDFRADVSTIFLLERLKSSIAVWESAVAGRDLSTITKISLVSIVNTGIPSSDSSKVLQSLFYIPRKILELNNLESLVIDGHPHLESLPDFFINLSHLKSITIQNNEKLKFVNTLPIRSVRFLSIRNNPVLQSLVDHDKMPKLDTLIIANNKQLAVLGEFPEYQPLRSVIIANNPNLIKISEGLWTHPGVISASIIANPGLGKTGLSNNLVVNCTFQQLILAGNAIKELPSWLRDDFGGTLFTECFYQGDYYSEP